MRTRTLLAFAFIILFTARGFSQTDQKGIRFGMLITPQLDWERSGNTKLYAHDGINGKFGFGLSMEFRVTDVVHFVTGIGGTFSGGGENYNMNDTIGYVVDKSQNQIKISDLNSTPSSLINPNNHPYRLIHRDYKTTYVTIPVALKMMTKPIGALKYFGEFGGNIEILTKAHANDRVLDMRSNSTATITLTDLNIYSDCIPVKASLNVGAGTEYNLSGTTSLVISLNYYRSFTPLSKGTSQYLFDRNTSSSGLTPLSHSIYGDGIALTIGILF